MIESISRASIEYAIDGEKSQTRNRIREDTRGHMKENKMK